MGSKKVLIFGSCPCPTWTHLEQLREEMPLVVCADGGLHCARAAGFAPQVYIGDGDSGGAPEQGLTCITLPTEKDWTDLEAAWRWALEQGGRDFTFTACTGGRQDHHLAALALLETACSLGVTARILDPWNCITCLLPGSHWITPKGYRYFSLLPMDAQLEDVTILGGKYPLQHATVRRGSSLTVSNEAVAEQVSIQIQQGRCWLIYSNDRSHT